METTNLPDRSEVASMGTATAVEKAFTGWPLPPGRNHIVGHPLNLKPFREFVLWCELRVPS
jgi:hypothetical protein